MTNDEHIGQCLVERGRRIAFCVIPLEEAVTSLDARADVVEHPHRRPRMEAAAALEGRDHRLAWALDIKARRLRYES